VPHADDAHVRPQIDEVLLWELSPQSRRSVLPREWSSGPGSVSEPGYVRRSRRRCAGIAGPRQLHHGRRRMATRAPLDEIAAQVAAADSPHRITVPAHRVGDGAGDLGVVQVDPFGHPRNLPADLVGRQGGDDGGGVPGGADPAFGPVQPVGPAGQPVVDDEVSQRRGGVQGRTQRLGLCCWASAAGSRPSGRLAEVGQAPVERSSS
jgi:hypothetical protein